jgi:hypothetical protein
MSLPRHTKERVTTNLRDSVLRRYALELTPEFITDILDGNPELLEDCQALHVDTSNREWFIGEVAVKVGVPGAAWPKGASTDEEWEAFKSQLRTLLPKHGQRYVITEAMAIGTTWRMDIKRTPDADWEDWAIYPEVKPRYEISGYNGGSVETLCLDGGTVQWDARAWSEEGLPHGAPEFIRYRFRLVD